MISLDVYEKMRHDKQNCNDTNKVSKPFYKE
jgi:hypothetical protein